MSDPKTSHDLVVDLRKLADKLEQGEPFPLPVHGQSNSGFRLFYVSVETDAFRQAVKVIGGQKSADELFYGLVSPLASLTIKVEGMRDAVCERVKVGEKVISKRVVPAQPATPITVIEEHCEDVYEWRCAPLLSQAEELSLGGE